MIFNLLIPDGPLVIQDFGFLLVSHPIFCNWSCFLCQTEVVRRLNYNAARLCGRWSVSSVLIDVKAETDRLVGSEKNKPVASSANRPDDGSGILALSER